MLPPPPPTRSIDNHGHGVETLCHLLVIYRNKWKEHWDKIYHPTPLHLTSFFCAKYHFILLQNRVPPSNTTFLQNALFSRHPHLLPGFVLLLLAVVCCQPTEFIWAFLFHKFSNSTPPPPAPYSLSNTTNFSSNYPPLFLRTPSVLTRSDSGSFIMPSGTSGSGRLSILRGEGGGG